MDKNCLKLEAELDKDFLIISLKKKGAIIGKIKISNDKTLSTKFLPLLDKFLKKHKIPVGEIKDIKLKSEMPDSFTSFRIVKVILETIKWGNTNCG